MLPLQPNQTLQLLLGDPKTFPGQKGNKIPPASSATALGSPPRRHPNQMPKPPQLTPFDAEE